MIRLFQYALLLSAFLFSAAYNAQAATIRTGENITLDTTERDLSDLYLFGGDIRVDAPVTNDVVAGGGDITITKEVSGSIIAGGGNINILSSVGNTVRAGGGEIAIDGPVGRDVIIGGGTVRISKNASISGDLLFAGGKLILLGPVKGDVTINGGEVVIDSTINGDVEGEIGDLQLGKNAVINGDLKYGSPKRATTADTAIIRGENSFHKVERSENTGREIGSIVRAGTYYKLFTDILFSILFVFLVPALLTNTFASIKQIPLRAGVIGFVTFFIAPIISLFLLLIIWLGVFSFVLYFLLLILAMVIANVFAGNLLLSFFYKHQKKEYILDWKAAIVGPIFLFILWLIPVIGWLLAFVFYLLSLGGVVLQLSSLITSQSAKKS